MNLKLLPFFVLFIRMKRLCLAQLKAKLKAKANNNLLAPPNFPMLANQYPIKIWSIYHWVTQVYPYKLFSNLTSPNLT